MEHAALARSHAYMFKGSSCYVVDNNRSAATFFFVVAVHGVWSGPNGASVLLKFIIRGWGQWRERTGGVALAAIIWRVGAGVCVAKDVSGRTGRLPYFTPSQHRSKLLGSQALELAKRRFSMSSVEFMIQPQDQFISRIQTFSQRLHIR